MRGKGSGECSEGNETEKSLEQRKYFTKKPSAQKSIRLHTFFFHLHAQCPLTLLTCRSNPVFSKMSSK